MKAFLANWDNQLIAGAFAFLVAAIAADGLSTYVAISVFGGQESNGFMTNLPPPFGNIVWAKFFIVQFAALTLYGGAGLLLRRLTQLPILTAAWFIYLATGSWLATLNNILVALRRSGVI